MLDTLIDTMAIAALYDLFLVLLGSFILYGLQKTYKIIMNTKHKRRLRSEISSYKKRKDAINVVDLANGDPEFEKSNIFAREVAIFGAHKSLYVGIPDLIREKIISRERDAGYMDLQLSKFHTDTSFNGKDNFDDIAQLTGILNLAELIEEHKFIAGEKLLEAKEGMLFNGDKYGVFNLKFTRFGQEEKPGVEIDLFRTDYYTHRVFRSIYHTLKDKNHPIASAGLSDYIKYKPFFTSFGINTLLICEGSQRKEIVLSKRSNRVHGNIPKYHISMNEGLSQTDKDPFGRVDLELCFKRGLLEELGINEKLYQYGIKGSFYDFFLERKNFEIGLSSVFEINLNFEKDIEPLIARDKQLEVDSFVVLPLNNHDIGKFIAEHEFVPHGLYVLEKVLLRENISVAKSISNASSRIS